MNTINVYKQLTHVKLKDGRVLKTQKSPKQIYDWLRENPFIYIEDEMHSRYSIESAIKVNIDELESLISSQSKEIQEKIREKKDWLKTTLGKDMSVSYAKHYLNSLLNDNSKSSGNNQ